MRSLRTLSSIASRRFIAMYLVYRPIFLVAGRSLIRRVIIIPPTTLGSVTKASPPLTSHRSRWALASLPLPRRAALLIASRFVRVAENQILFLSVCCLSVCDLLGHSIIQRYHFIYVPHFQEMKLFLPVLDLPKHVGQFDFIQICL